MSALGDIRSSGAEENVANSFYMYSLTAGTITTGSQTIDGDLTVTGETDTGSLVVETTTDMKGTLTVDPANVHVINNGPGASISISNTNSSSGRAGVDLSGGSSVSGTFNIEQDTGGVAYLDNTATNASLYLVVNGTGTVNSTNLVINGGSTLTNYVQGTFTPYLYFDGSGTGVTYTTQLGKYTSIGNRCDFVINIVASLSGVTSGSATIQDLPFVPVTGFTQSALVYQYGASKTNATQLCAQISNLTSTIIDLYWISATTTSAFPAVATNSDFTSSIGLTIQGTYFDA